MSIGTLNQSTRNEWVKKTLLGIPKGKKILDAGAGEQQYKKYCSHLKYTSQDFAQYDPKELDGGLQMSSWNYGKLDIISDITSIPVNNSSYDVILCTEVFEHIINPMKALEEFNRILKKGGLLILTAPFASFTHFAPHHYSTGFSKYFYKIILPKYGFEIVSIENNGNYFHFIAQEIRRIPFMVEKYIRHKYVAIILKLTSHVITMPIIATLEVINILSDGSEEFSVFGFHVIAKKIK